MIYRRPWFWFAALAALGAAVYLGLSEPRAALSYVGGVLTAGVVFTGGAAVVRWADRGGPAMSMMMALMTYAMVVVVLAAVLALVDPDVVDVGALALGLAASALLWIAAALWTARLDASR